ncbi:MAG: DUF4380 domain-containing protein [Candidatus Omnitrophica bacterium]|nr:DUF4380 domain-containing protein [Candidatus Omnitrophota bacterium]
MEIFEENICGWRCYRLSAGDVSLGVVPAIGGRILSLTFRGEELLYVHGPEAGRTYDFSAVKDLRSFKKDFGFRIWGGDKTWIAPEKDWWESIPPLELDAGQYAFEAHGTGVVMTSPVCRETGLQLTRRVSLASDGVISLEQDFFNTTSREIVRGIWNVTQVLKPFDVYVPADLKNVRSYYHEDPTLPRHEVELVSEDGWVKIACSGNVCYKFGAMVREGKAVLVRETARGKVAIAYSFSADPDRRYAHNSIVEVFNAERYGYGEIEIHSPLLRIPPLGRGAFRQEWRLSVDS